MSAYIINIILFCFIFIQSEILGQSRVKEFSDDFTGKPNIIDQLDRDNYTKIQNSCDESDIGSESLSQFISKSGIFNLTYETTGSNSVPLMDLDQSGIPDYIESISNYFDNSMNIKQL